MTCVPFDAGRSHTLRPGGVIASGTPAGGPSLELGRKLQQGDVVGVEVRSLGVVRNHIGRKGA
jgi:2-keto-4-pentenoate hydratase/2-oxohepta-3-ene-1,7-dioic acid hydratase in catechol pathway